MKLLTGPSKIIFLNKELNNYDLRKMCEIFFFYKSIMCVIIYYTISSLSDNLLHSRVKVNNCLILTG